jgi:hypothetical protein
MTNDLVTVTQQDIFLAEYRKTGLLQQAAKLAGLTKQDINAYCHKKTADAESFVLNMQDAADSWGDVIREELTRRAITGIDKDIYYKGEYVATEKVYSDALLIKMAESTLPEYKKQEVKDQGQITISINTFGPPDQQQAPFVVDITDIKPTYVSDLE